MEIVGGDFSDIFHVTFYNQYSATVVSPETSGALSDHLTRITQHDYLNFLLYICADIVDCCKHCESATLGY